MRKLVKSAYIGFELEVSPIDWTNDKYQGQFWDLTANYPGFVEFATHVGGLRQQQRIAHEICQTGFNPSPDCGLHIAHNGDQKLRNQCFEIWRNPVNRDYLDRAAGRRPNLWCDLINADRTGCAISMNHSSIDSAPYIEFRGFASTNDPRRISAQLLLVCELVKGAKLGLSSIHEIIGRSRQRAKLEQLADFVPI